MPPSRSACCSFAPRAVDEVDAGRGDLLDRQPLGAADHGNDEPAVGRHRHADVGRRVDPHLLAGELGVQPPVAHERRRGDLREDVRDRRLRAVLRELDELLAERERPAHVRRHGDLEDRRLPGLGQAARDRLADRRQRHDLDLARRGAAGAQPQALRPAPSRPARRPRRRSVPPALCRGAARGRCRARGRSGGRAATPSRVRSAPALEPRSPARTSRDAARRPPPRSASRSGAREPSSCGVSSTSVSSACGTSSPSSPMTATVCPTGTSPSWTASAGRPRPRPRPPA